MGKSLFGFLEPHHSLAAILGDVASVRIPRDRQELLDLALGGPGRDTFEVVYDVPENGTVVEATVVRCRNGIAVNYPDITMRRRDPDCMVIADRQPTDKARFEERYGEPFEPLREKIFEWLRQQPLIALPFMAGSAEVAYPALLVGPANAAFFAAALADLQGMIPDGKIPDDFAPRAVIYLAPPFRHTHFGGRQVVIHNRAAGLHEIFSLNLYPGPSAKKGIYGVLLSIGEKEGWITAHASTVRLVTPYDNEVVIMHEGASGGGKSEMLEHVHRQPDGRLLLGQNVATGERRLLALSQGCQLHPVTDDMALCHPALQNGGGKLSVSDAEKAWFLRINHITRYGTDPHLERLCVHPEEPLIFLNLAGVPGSTCLIWEHTEDQPGQPCPNPRVIVSRRLVPGVVNEPVEVDIRSLGLRTPPCTRSQPSYGILGLLHFLPPALGWLWRLVAPRGHDNPSITTGDGLVSEGVGSYWPFATGRRVDHANLLLRQIQQAPNTRYTLIPNQHIGAWKVGFMPQWIAREYLARRGAARFKPGQLVPARSSLLGYTLFAMQIEGVQIPRWLLEVQLQNEIGEECYDAGAQQLQDFFRAELLPYRDEPQLDSLGREIIECCLQGGQVGDYERLLPLGRL
jgi:hypothetical protein